MIYQGHWRSQVCLLRSQNLGEGCGQLASDFYAQAATLLFIPIVLAGGVQGLIGMLTKKKTIPYTVAITLGTAAWLWLSAGR